MRPCIRKTCLVPAAALSAIAVALTGCTASPAPSGVRHEGAAAVAVSTSPVLPSPLLREMVQRGESARTVAAPGLWHPHTAVFSRNDHLMGSTPAGRPWVVFSAAVIEMHDHQHTAHGRPFDHFHQDTRTIRAIEGR